MREKLVILRNFLYKFFLIGFVLNVMFQLLLLAMGGRGIIEASKILELPSYFLHEVLIIVIVSVRVFFVFFVLCPALALHWAIAKDKTLNKLD